MSFSLIGFFFLLKYEDKMTETQHWDDVRHEHHTPVANVDGKSGQEGDSINCSQLDGQLVASYYMFRPEPK